MLRYGVRGSHGVIIFGIWLCASKVATLVMTRFDYDCVKIYIGSDFLLWSGTYCSVWAGDHNK